MEEEGEYKFYFLFDPRDDILCYVGITKQKFKDRLNQHRNPVHSNKTPIAKLQRFLKKNGMSLYGRVMMYGCKEQMEHMEKFMIKLLRECEHRKIKNVQDGGLNALINTPDVVERAKRTKKLNKKKGLHKNTEGENSPTNKVTEKQVLEIYRLIRSFYSNNEIIEELNLDIGKTGLNQIRQGKNWKYLWEREKMTIIPSTHKEKGGLPTIEKLKIIEGFVNGLSVAELHKQFPKLTQTDLKRIQNKEIWSPIWNLHDNFYNKQ